MFIVNGVKFSGRNNTELRQKILSEIKKLPQLKSSFDEVVFSPIEPEKTVTCLQREIVWGEKNSSVQYIITKALTTCIFVMIFSETDFLAIHIDSTRTSNLFKGIEKFSSKDNIKIVFIGGRAYEDSISFDNLDFAISQLYDCFLNLSKMNIKANFTILNQKLFDTSKLTQKGQTRILFDMFCLLIDMVTRRYFKKSYHEFISQEKFTLAFLDENDTDVLAKNCKKFINALLSWREIPNDTSLYSDISKSLKKFIDK